MWGIVYEYYRSSGVFMYRTPSFIQSSSEDEVLVRVYRFVLDTLREGSSVRFYDEHVILEVRDAGEFYWLALTVSTDPDGGLHVDNITSLLGGMA